MKEIEEGDHPHLSLTSGEIVQNHLGHDGQGQDLGGHYPDGAFPHELHEHIHPCHTRMQI